MRVNGALPVIVLIPLEALQVYIPLSSGERFGMVRKLKAVSVRSGRIPPGLVLIVMLNLFTIESTIK